ncbi:hypothetical protein PR048_013606 [Dryococelus australis]|uniref:BED-type domain-containing protein n=1 Tax=Dryococelus australis TaxID=614101 RepID=A0ABQ9HTI1_9NEOP|nr:hypothetical protein PR048_013606 [Dryococelus australis]
MSVVWNHFSIDADENYAVCMHCDIRITRGVSKSISDLMKHSRMHHRVLVHWPTSLKNLCLTAQNSKQVYFCPRQQTLKSIELQSSIVQLIAKMVCIDGQPLSIFFNDHVKHLEPRFSMPSRKHLAKEIIPTMYTKVMGRIKEELHNVKFVGITTDIWTSVSYDDYLSLTIHYLDTNFCLHNCCFEGVPFPEVCHTLLTNSVSDWDCHKKLLLSFLRQWSQHHSWLGNVFILTYTLPSMYFPFRFEGRSRRLAGHFNHSAHAAQILKKCQITTTVPLHRLIQN